VRADFEIERGFIRQRPHHRAKTFPGSPPNFAEVLWQNRLAEIDPVSNKFPLIQLRHAPLLCKVNHMQNTSPAAPHGEGTYFEKAGSSAESL
jgi:hypothetical protein